MMLNQQIKLLLSDVLDSNMPTEVLPFTINTEQGFCNKTRAMLDR